MKFRLGFISNSSSCSFLIHGIFIENTTCKEIEEALQKFDTFTDEVIVSGGGCACWEDKEYNLFIGLDYSTIKDNETGKEFKERAQLIADRVMDNIGRERIVCSTHKREWHD